MTPACQLNEVKALLCAIARVLTGRSRGPAASALSGAGRPLLARRQHPLSQRPASVGEFHNGQTTPNERQLNDNAIDGI